MSQIVNRKSSPKPPRFKAGQIVAFVANGNTYQGVFVKTYTPTRNAGLHYDIKVDGQTATLFANSQQGRSVTVQKGAQS